MSIDAVLALPDCDGCSRQISLGECHTSECENALAQDYASGSISPSDDSYSDAQAAYAQRNPGAYCQSCSRPMVHDNHYTCLSCPVVYGPLAFDLNASKELVIPISSGRTMFVPHCPECNNFTCAPPDYIGFDE